MPAIHLTENQCLEYTKNIKNPTQLKMISRYFSKEDYKWLASTQHIKDARSISDWEMQSETRSSPSDLTAITSVGQDARQLGLLSRVRGNGHGTGAGKMVHSS